MTKDRLRTNSEAESSDRRHQLPCEPVFVFYDGQCATCHLVVRFLIRRSRQERFRFISLHSLMGRPLEAGIRKNLDLDLKSSLIVWKNGELLSQFSAVSAILSELGWPWYMFLVLRLLPLRAMNFLYDLYARHRYQIMGKAKNPDICQVVPPAQRALFQQQWNPERVIFAKRDRVFLSAQWRNLILINYRVPAALLQEFVPPGTELDDWQGEVLMSLVAFSFAGTSVLGMTLPFCSDFEEVNLRFYVKRHVLVNGEWHWRRAVVFIREIVPFGIIAGTANLFYGEHYAKLRMDHRASSLKGQKTLSYSWADAQGECQMTAEYAGDPTPLQKGSLAEFITEHYYGYAKKGKSGTTEYEVEHPRWRTWNEAKVSVQGDFARYYPTSLAPYLKEPHSLLLAEGSPVRVYRGISF
jgi:uncharacterized protein